MNVGSSALPKIYLQRGKTESTALQIAGFKLKIHFLELKKSKLTKSALEKEVVTNHIYPDEITFRAN